MKGIVYNIILVATTIWFTSCGTEVAKEQIHDLPQFNEVYYGTVLKALNDKIESVPQNADVYFKKGEVLEKLNNPDNALINYKKAIRLDSLNPGYYKSMAGLFYKQDKLLRAEENALKALQLGDQTAELHQLLADIYIQKGEYTVALNHLNRAIETAPGNSLYTYRKGKLYLQLGDTVKAKDFLVSNMYRISPGAEVYGALADIYVAERNYAQAIVFLDSSIHLSGKGRTDLQVKKANVLQKSGNVSSAKTIIIEQLKEDSTNFALNFKMAELHFSSYGYDSALYYLNHSILKDGKSKEAYMLMGKVYDRKRMYLTAQEQFKNALLIDPGYQQAKNEILEIDKKLAYIQRQKAQEAQIERNRLPQLESIKPEIQN